MSSDDDTTVICGSGGTPITDKTITVYDAPFSVAIKIDRQALYNLAVAEGMSPSKVQKRLERFIRLVEADWDSWGDFLEDKLCIEYTRHEPHSQP